MPVSAAIENYGGGEHQITAVEHNPKIAEIYQKLFPKDTVVIGDAHQYLLEHYGEFDFIWSSPPCPTHSRINLANHLSPYKDNTKQIENGGGIKPRFPDMALYQEIILLRHYFKGLFCVENVISYYDPLIEPMKIGKHYFWMNFLVPDMQTEDRAHNKPIEVQQIRKGFDLTEFKGIDKTLALQNAVEPEIGRRILEYAMKPAWTQNKLY